MKKGTMSQIETATQIKFRKITLFATNKANELNNVHSEMGRSTVPYAPVCILSTLVNVE
jgi:hypothetical protein